MVVEQHINLIKQLHWSAALTTLSILCGLAFLVVLIHHSVSGIRKREVNENGDSKTYMKRTQKKLWILLGILAAKILIDLYLIDTLGDELQNCVKNNPEAIQEYNKNSDHKIVVVYSNGTVLFAPEYSSCIKVRRVSNRKYYSNERRLLEDFVYSGIRYCDAEGLIIIYAEVFSRQVKGTLFTGFILLYAIVLVLFAIWSLTYFYLNRKYCTAYIGKKK